MASTCAAAVTVGDPGGHFLLGLRRLGPALASLFPRGGASLTDNTHPDIEAFLREDLGWQTTLAAPDGRIGLHRRRAVGLASGDGGPVLYSDLDHLLRWMEAAPGELAAVAADDRVDLLVVGRSPAAMAASPARLRETERIVNRIYEVMTGCAWDLMFAVRRLSAPAAAAVLAGCTEDSVANDVEWPLFAERAGYSLGYAASDHLHYRVREDFDAAADARDGDPLQWIHRMDIASLHVAVLRRYAESNAEP